MWCHSDFHIWPTTAKISAVHPWVTVNTCAKFEENPSKCSWDIVFTRNPERQTDGWADKPRTSCLRPRLSPKTVCTLMLLLTDLNEYRTVFCESVVLCSLHHVASLHRYKIFHVCIVMRPHLYAAATLSVFTRSETHLIDFHLWWCDEDTSSHDSTLFHDIINLRLFLLFWSSSRNHKHCAFNESVKMDWNGSQSTCSTMIIVQKT